jgi:hypothetical protein
MRSLACLVPWARLQAHGATDRVLLIEALLLGGAGLLRSQRAHRGPVESHVIELESAFARAGIRPLPPDIWKLWGIRPENHPVRRIAGAAALFARLATPSDLFGTLEARSVREAIAPLLVESAPFWRGRYDLCAAPCRLPASMIGRSRALEVLVNVVIPAAVGCGEESVRAQALRLYERLPRAASYGVTKFIENALASEGTRVPVNARRGQGLLALHRDWCTQNGCGRCPLS